jgi:hypothetical protein
MFPIQPISQEKKTGVHGENAQKEGIMAGFETWL